KTLGGTEEEIRLRHFLPQRQGSAFFSLFFLSPALQPSFRRPTARLPHQTRPMPCAGTIARAIIDAAVAIADIRFIAHLPNSLSRGSGRGREPARRDPVPGAMLRGQAA